VTHRSDAALICFREGIEDLRFRFEDANGNHQRLYRFLIWISDLVGLDEFVFKFGQLSL